MSAMPDPADYDLIIFGNKIFDRVMDIGEGFKQWFDGHPKCGWAFFTLRAGVIGGEKIGQELQVSLIERFFKQLSYDSFVTFNW